MAWDARTGRDWHFLGFARRRCVMLTAADR
jgi:hypothetical protein